MHKPEEVMQRVQEHLDAIIAEGYEWVLIALAGSQNYGLADELSDVDTKVIVLPKIDDLILGRSPVSTTYVMPNNEHVDVKDIRHMFANYRKQNINFLETLFTPYMIINETYKEDFMPILDHKEEIARYDTHAALNSMRGQSISKFAALEHRSPATEYNIDTYGYEGKQLANIIRINDFMDKYVDESYSYAECITPESVEEHMKAKRQKYSLEEAKRMAQYYLNRTVSTATYYLANNEKNVNKSIEVLMDNVTKDIIKAAFKRSLLI